MTPLFFITLGTFLWHNSNQEAKHRPWPERNNGEKRCLELALLLPLSGGWQPIYADAAGVSWFVTPRVVLVFHG